MRICLANGHRRGLNVLLRPASLSHFDPDNPTDEYGIGNFVMLENEQWTDPIIETDNDFLERTQWLANVAERFGLPFLLGQGKNFERMKDVVNLQIGNYGFPKNGINSICPQVNE